MPACDYKIVGCKRDATKIVATFRKLDLHPHVGINVVCQVHADRIRQDYGSSYNVTVRSLES